MKAVLLELMRLDMVKTFDLNAPRNLKTMEKSLQSMEEIFGSASADRIIDVCITGAYRYGRQDSPYVFPQLIGETIIKDTSELTKGRKYFQDKWLVSCGTSRKQLEDLAATIGSHPLQHMIYVMGEDYTKQHHHNTEAGFLSCQLSTTGWAPRSPWCQSCNYTDKCKAHTEKEYHELYRIRAEDYEGNRN